MKTIKSVILLNTTEQPLGCIHCGETDELTIDDLQQLNDNLDDLFKERIKNKSNKIINGLNEKFSLDLKTVDSMHMQEYIESVLNKRSNT